VEAKLKHLDFIQQTVNRMASNLFLLKGWTVTLIAGLFALAETDSRDIYFLIAYLPPAMFWALDGYFLAQERRFRALYDHVRTLDESQIDFSMDTQPFSKTRRTSWLGAMFSATLVIYYGSLLVVMLVLMVMIGG
jgi:hypothetical protein